MSTPLTLLEEQRRQENPADQQLVDRYERCSFCQTKLLFTHDLNLDQFQVVESSRCPGCGVSMQPQKHPLQ